MLAVVALAAAASWWWSAQPPEPRTSKPAQARQTAPAQAPAVVASGPAYPLDTSNSPPIAAADVPAALGALLGERAVASLLQVDDFPRRVVATLDNLGRPHAPVAAWPLQPTPGRFTVEERPDGPVIAASNADRYADFMKLVDSVDVQKAAELYLRMYPLLQEAYRQLGFGDRPLNDRMVEVIDLLLATPEPAQAPKLELVEVKGSVPALRPWVRFQYSDARLEALSSGQKILVRVGLANERRMKAKLSQFRQRIVPAGRGPERR